MNRRSGIILFSIALLIIGLYGCAPTDQQTADEKERQQREARVREKVADATQRAKPELEKAGQKLGEVAKTVAADAKAAAQGVKEGWNRDEHHPLDLNSAGESELRELPGISEDDARMIITKRPYRNTRQFVTSGI